MAFGITTRGLPHGLTYEYAQKMFVNSKAVRSVHWSPDWRPLRTDIHGRRDSNKLLVRHDDGSYSARLYRADLVRWYPNGEVHVRTHDNGSSARFVCSVSPFCAFIRNSRMYVFVRTDDGEQFLSCGSSEPLAFVRSTHGWRLLNPDAVRRAKTRVLNRGRAKQARELIRPFENWVQSICAMGDGDVTSLFPTKRPLGVSSKLLIDVLREGPIPPEQYVDALGNGLVQAQYAHRLPVAKLAYVVSSDWRDVLRRTAYIALDAFDTREVPFGELPPRSRR